MIRVVTDSGANLSPDLLRAEGILAVPLNIHMGSSSFKEGVDLSSEAFYQKLPTASPAPTTSQPSPAEYEEVYRRFLDQGDEVIVVTLSSKLSGTYNSAIQGRQLLGGDPSVSVVDSLSASAGEGMMAIAAARAARAGRSRAEIVAMLEQMVRETYLAFTLDTLEYLRRGGRIGGAQAFLGSILRVKPVIILKDGKVEAGDRARSRRRAIERLVEMAGDRYGDQPVWLGVAHAVAEEDMNQLEAEARRALNVVESVRCEIGPVVGTHTGPGTLGLAAVPAPSI